MKTFRTRLLLLILLAVLPGVAIVIIENLRQHEASYQREMQNLEQISRVVTAAQEKTVLSVKQSLVTAALLAQQATESGESCSESLRNFLSQFSSYNNFIITDAAGNPLCIAKPITAAINYSDRQYFQDALREGKIAASGYIQSRTTGKPSIAFALPISNQGQVRTVAIVSVEVTLFTSVLETIDLPKNLIIGMTDEAGKILARRPALAQFEGITHPVDAVREAIRKKAPMRLQAPGLDRIERLYSITPVFPESGAPFTVFVGSSYEDLMQPSDHALVVNLLGFMLAIAIAFAGTWQLGEQWMVKPLKNLIAVIGRIAGGDFGARTGMDYRQGELGKFARHVDEMSQALRQREAEAQAAREKIETLAHTDDVTGLPNRIHFKEVFERQIKKSGSEEHSFCVMFVDLDGFRYVNDTQSHTVGDRVLNLAGQRIRQALGDMDFAARLSADSFACILPSCADANGARRLAEKMLESLRQPYLAAKEAINLGAKIGISVFPSDGTDSSTLLKHADTAMRRAKASGKHDIESFDRELDAHMIKGWSLQVELGHAVERNELLLYYQPKISAKTGELTGYEALLRWRHPTRGLVSPAEFIPLAESTRLIIPIGEWVLMEACRQGKNWIARGFPRIPIAVNVSAEQFQHSDVKRSVEKALSATGYPPDLLELEITEGVLLRGVEGELEALKALGISLSVDDFGTGYSSLSYLRHMPVSKLKVDQSFVRGITKNPADKAITTAIVSMAKSLALSVVAEGVETDDALRILKEMGCDEIQGYYYSKPLPANEAELFCRSWVPR